MKETIEWYNQNQYNINLPKPSRLGYIEIEGKLKDISIGKLIALKNLMSKNALERSVFGKVIVKPETYFLPNASQKMKEGEDPTTLSLNNAMSSTAIVPSFYLPVSLKKSNIELYNIPQKSVTDKKTREIILAQGFLHELAHTLNFIPRYENDKRYNVGKQFLLLSDGSKMTGDDCMNKFGELFEKLSEPMSIYSQGYHKGNEFYNPQEPLLMVDEELSETIAAYKLGFVFSNSKERRFNPFIDRPEVEKFTREYLEAKLI